MMKKEEFNEFKLNIAKHMAEVHHARQGVDGPSEAQLLEVTITGMALNLLEGVMFDLQDTKALQDKLNAMKAEEDEADVGEEYGA